MSISSLVPGFDAGCLKVPPPNEQEVTFYCETLGDRCPPSKCMRHRYITSATNMPIFSAPNTASLPPVFAEELSDGNYSTGNVTVASIPKYDTKQFPFKSSLRRFPAFDSISSKHLRYSQDGGSDHLD